MRSAFASATHEAEATELETTIGMTIVGLEARASACADAWAEDDPFNAARARMVALDVRSRCGDAAGAQAGQLDLLAQLGPWPVLAARLKMMLSTSCERLGERSAANRWSQESMQSWPDGERPEWRAYALMIFVVNSLTRNGADYGLVRHAVDEIRTHCSPVVLSVTLANFAEIAAECNDLPESLEFADAAEALLARHPEVTAPLTLDSIARSRLATGDLAGADHCLTRALELEPVLGCTDVNGDPWLTAAEVKLALGQPDAAMDLLDHPRRQAWAAKSAWTACRDLRVRAAVLAAQGRWEQAYAALLDHIDRYEQMRSIEGDREVAETETQQVAAEERRRAARFEALALTDPLTGLPNRRAVEHWLREGGATETTATDIAIVDIDHFKSINDTWGHDIGDVVLERVAEVLRRECVGRPSRFVARLGGEEFVVLDVESTSRFLADVDDLLHAITELDVTDVASGRSMSASAGVATGPAGSMSELLHAADVQLYRAKHAGRGVAMAESRPPRVLDVGA